MRSLVLQTRYTIAQLLSIAEPTRPGGCVRAEMKPAGGAARLLNHDPPTPRV
jgi:hypothetical protein